MRGSMQVTTLIHFPRLRCPQLLPTAAPPPLSLLLHHLSPLTCPVLHLYPLLLLRTEAVWGKQRHTKRKRKRRRKRNNISLVSFGLPMLSFLYFFLKKSPVHTMEWNSRWWSLPTIPCSPSVLCHPSWRLLVRLLSWRLVAW